MTKPTPDRAPLAERLRDYASMTLIGHHPDLVLVNRSVLTEAAAALAAPAVPPSVVEAREAVVSLVTEALDPDTGVDVPATVRTLNAALDALIADALAEAVRVVEEMPRYVLKIRRGYASSMKPASDGAWINKSETIADLRALQNSLRGDV